MSARYFRIVIAVFVALGMLSGATAAFADPDYPPGPEEVPEPEVPEVEEEIEEQPDPVPPRDEVAEEETAVLGVALPRTGTSVTLLALVGAVLIGLGALLVTRRRSSGEPA